MRGKIQRFPAALLPLLSIKASETPPELEQFVAPGLEMMPSYVADRMEIQTATVNGITTATFAASIAVPAGEYWYLQNLSGFASNITAASNVQLGLGVADPTNNNTYVAGHDAQHVSIAGQRFQISWDPAFPLLLRPGMILTGGTLVAPTSLDFTLRALVARLTPQ